MMIFCNKTTGRANAFLTTCSLQEQHTDRSCPEAPARRGTAQAGPKLRLQPVSFTLKPSDYTIPSATAHLPTRPKSLCEGLG